MLLTITSTTPPATDLGYLLHKNPNRVQTFELSFGSAHVFYPEAGPERCTAALLLDVDPVGLVRGRRAGPGFDQDGGQYVSDRPYVASSFLSVAIGEVYGTALAGRSRERPELAETALPLTARLSVVPARGGEPMLRRLFEPLGYAVSAQALHLDERFPDWGESPYYAVELQGSCRLQALLTHLSVLMPVLDDRKHYLVGDDEVAKLLRRGEGWLASHPARALISNRYLKYRRGLVRAALDRLAEDLPDEAMEDKAVEDEAIEDEAIEDKAVEDEAADDAMGALASGETCDGPGGTAETPTPDRDDPLLASAVPERDASPAAGPAAGPPGLPPSLAEQRIAAVLAALKAAGARSVLDLGCGEGRLLAALLRDRSFERIVGVDGAYRSLERARARLRLDRLPPLQAERVTLLHGALTYRDRRLQGFDAAAVVEVVEHLDPPRLFAFERVLFEQARPGTVVVTTPNAEYNVRYPGLAAGSLRHADHRFEWTRAEFQAWGERVAAHFGYRVQIAPVGADDPEVGAPTQLAVFSR